MSYPLVTVGMPVFNGEKTLARAIHSLMWQDFKDWELIILDDGSTDKTEEVARTFKDSRIHLVRESHNQGLGLRLNQCVALSRGRYFARMDADDVAYPDRLGKQVSCLDSQPEVDLLGNGVLLFHGAGNILGLYPTASEHGAICSRPWWGFPMAHPTWMGKLSWFRRFRYREDALKGQDQELLLRSFRESNFSSINEILLGYRLERVSPWKLAIGRYHFCQTLIGQVQSIESAVVACRGVGIHTAAFLKDVVIDTIGRREQKPWLSIAPASQSNVDRWKVIWDDLNRSDTQLGQSIE